MTWSGPVVDESGHAGNAAGSPAALGGPALSNTGRCGECGCFAGGWEYAKRARTGQVALSGRQVLSASWFATPGMGSLGPESEVPR